MGLKISRRESRFRYTENKENKTVDGGMALIAPISINNFC